MHGNTLSKTVGWMLAISERISLLGTGGRIRRSEPLKNPRRVSVVVPCYNYGRYLPQCVHSVTHNQPGVEVEVIVVDDASTDDSAAVAEALHSEDPRVRLIRHARNRGHIATYNDGLAAVTGDYVMLLSADDLATPGALPRAVALFEAEPSVGLVYGGVLPFSSRLPPCRTAGSRWIVWRGPDWLRARCRSGYNVVASPEVMLRMSVLRQIGGYRADLPHAGDFEMWMRAAAAADVGFLAGVDQAYYRKHDNNMHRRSFDAGTARGQLVDLGQRWQSFEAVLSAASLPERELLLGMARRTLVRQALDQAKYAFARGHRDFPLRDFEQFIHALAGEAERRRADRALARRRRFGLSPLPLHPLWAPHAIAWRLGEVGRRWRRGHAGI